MPRTDSFYWEFTSSGVGAWYDVSAASDSVIFYAQTNGIVHSTVIFQTEPSTSSTTPVATLGASTGLALSTGETRYVTFNHALAYVRPRVEAITSQAAGALGVRVDLVGTGPW